jgi:L-threonylcarbamoyladenylate synthase
MKEDIREALAVLKKGGTILYPTDTIWGIGCDATNPEAVEKVYKLKERDKGKSMLVLVDYPSRIDRYVDEVPEIAYELVELSEKPLTIIYPKAQFLAENLIAEDGSIGIRVVNDPFCQELITRFKKPIVSTSANISGVKPPSIFSEVKQEIIDAVDYVVHWRQDDVIQNPPSGIIKLGTKGEVEVIRE